MEKDPVVKDLLGNHIPVNEAKVLSNGRITCLICVHRPIFDTLGVLVAHRKGKKHASELNKYLQRKGELEFIKLKKKQVSTIQKSSKQNFRTAKFTRKPKLELPAEPIGNQEACSSLKGPAQLSIYLKKIQKKPSFKDTLIKIKEQYSPSLNVNATSCKKNKRLVSSSNEIQERSTKLFDAKSAYEKELQMSGWIKDSTGNWIKDVNAEFDSDEDFPPNLT